MTVNPPRAGVEARGNTDTGKASPQCVTTRADRLAEAPVSSEYKLGEREMKGGAVSVSDPLERDRSREGDSHSNLMSSSQWHQQLVAHQIRTNVLTLNGRCLSVRNS